MAALAYLLPPVTGVIAYFRGRDPRVRFHGLQALLFGALWPLALYAGSAVGPGATFGAFVAGLGLWVILLAGTAIGRDPSLPGLRGVLRGAAARPPGGRAL